MDEIAVGGPGAVPAERTYHGWWCGPGRAQASRLRGSSRTGGWPSRVSVPPGSGLWLRVFRVFGVRGVLEIVISGSSMSGLVRSDAPQRPDHKARPPAVGEGTAALAGPLGHAGRGAWTTSAGARAGAGPTGLTKPARAPVAD